VNYLIAFIPKVECRISFLKKEKKRRYATSSSATVDSRKALLAARAHSPLRSGKSEGEKCTLE